MTIRKYLKIGNWNIHSLKSRLYDKSTDKTFLWQISHYNIFCFKETKHENVNVVDFCIDENITPSKLVVMWKMIFVLLVV